MKKYIIAAILIILAQAAWAAPAKPGKRTYTQPDGTTIVIQLHGDEFFHWVTDESGQVVEMDENGYYRPATLPSEVELSARKAIRSQAQDDRLRRSLAANRSNTGTRKFMVILVEFDDLEFEVQNPRETFTRLLNEEGFSDGGATGSVRDYYFDNSGGAFIPSFDVFGPVKVSQSYKYYGTDKTPTNPRYSSYASEPAAEALWEGIQQVVAEEGNEHIFDDYDSDGDGYVDAVVMYYAGFNEAEGAPSNTIWPHEWTLSAWDTLFGSEYGSTQIGNVKFNTYSCTSELQGTSGVTLCGIGTACHEFGHAMGLPDFYDTYTSDDDAGGLYCYSTMCSGNYNNNAHTPPYLNAEERMILGWLDGLTMMPSSGAVTIPSIATNFAYKTNSDEADEYFVYECRPGTGWDAPLQAGMIVYHVDKSSKHSVLSYTAKSIWNTNYINGSGSHPCFYIIPAADQTSLNYPSAAYDFQNKVGYLPFPGLSGEKTYTPVAWSGETMDYKFTGIAFNRTNETVTMNVSSSSCLLTGRVQTKKKVGIPGASVKVYAASSPVSEVGPLKARAFAFGTVLAETVTDDSGSYTIDMSSLSGTSFDIEASAEGYVTTRLSVTVGSGVNTQDITLLSENPQEEELLYKYDEESQMYRVGYGSGSIMGAVGFTADELKEDVGRSVDALSFVYSSELVDGAYVVIDFGSERKCWVPVDEPVSGAYNTVDLRGYNIVIPADTDCYFGFALENPSDGYPLIFEKGEPQDGGMYFSSFSEGSSNWKSYAGNIIVDVTLSPSVPFNHIVDPKNGNYALGDVFTYKLVMASNHREPTSVKWYFDDEPDEASSVRLGSAGVHTITAELIMLDGNKKVIELEINVE